MKTKAPDLPKTEFSSLPGWISASVAGFATFLVFLPALQNAFLDWDDKDTLLTNFQFRGLGAKQLAWMFTTYHMGPYQPLSWLTYAIDYTFGGLNPTPYHLTNLLIHSFNAALFFFLIRRLLALGFQCEARELRITLSSLAGALFFSIHPLRVESVAWATERRDVLSGFFFLAAALSYFQRWAKPGYAAQEKRWYGISLILFACSLLSKATAIGLVWALLALDVYPLGRLPLDPKHWWGKACRPVLREKIPYIALAAAAVLNGMFGLSGALHPYPWFYRISAFLYGAVFYLQKTLWPGTLSPLNELPARFTTMAPTFAMYALIAFLITIWLYIWRRRFPAGLLSWGYYLLTLAPVSGLAQNGPQLVAARYSYLACMPYAILAAAGFGWGWDAIKGQRWLLPAATAGLLALLGWLSWDQTKEWKDDFTLWSYAVRLDPSNSRALTNLGADFAKTGKPDDALAMFQRALEINPSLGEAHRNRGLILAGRGQMDAAIAEYQSAEETQPERPEAYMNLAQTYQQMGKLDLAIDQYGKGLEHNTPHVAEAYSNLALALSAQGKLDEAILYDRKAAQLRPELPQIHFNLASALARSGQTSEAISEAILALQLNPNYAKAHYLYGTLLKQQGNGPEGDKHLQIAAQLGLR